jgi:hypothetical protein
LTDQHADGLSKLVLLVAGHVVDPGEPALVDDDIGRNLSYERKPRVGYGSGESAGR